MPNIGSLVRNAVKEVLQDPDTGLNPNLIIYCNEAGLDPVQIDWDTEVGQYYESYISHTEILASGTPVYPMVCLYVLSSEDTKERKYNDYSGVVRIGITVMQSVIGGNAITNGERYQDAAEDALIATLHPKEANGAMALMGAYSLRDTVVSRDPVVQDAENWLMSLTANFTCQVDQ